MSTRTLSIARGIGVIGATAAIMVGATFASLTSTATLSNNTINSATASLLVWNGANFASDAQGFQITGLAPGDTSSPFAFYFKNAGDVDFALAVQASNDTGNIDPSLVTLTFKDDSTNNTNAYTLAQLTSSPQGLSDVLPAGATGDSNTAGHVGNYSVTVTLDSSVNVSGGSIDPFTLTFTGTQQ